MSARIVAAVVVAAVAGGALGFVAGRTSTGDAPEAAPQSAPAPSAPPATPRPRARAAVATDDAPREKPAPDGPAVPAPALAPGPDPNTLLAPLPRPAEERGMRSLMEARLAGLAGVEFPAARVADAQARSRRLRDQALYAASSSDAAAAWQVADEIARERSFAIDHARGGTMEMLRGLEKSQVRLFGRVGDREAFGALFIRREVGPVIEGAKWDRAEGLPHGATLSFPAGTHSWSASTFDHVKEFPRDVLVQGAGMDATLVRIDEIGANAEVANLTFRDLTIDCGDNYMTDLRSKNPITLRLERCRVTGFDMAAGGSVMLAAETAAFYATDCRFEAGYGRTDPESGNLFRVGSGLLVRCEGSVFRGPFRSVFDSDDAATYVFSKCRFERMEPEFGKHLSSPPDGVRFEDCTTVEPLERGIKLEKRPLSDFNAAWPSKTR